MFLNQIWKYFGASRKETNTSLIADSPLCKTCSALDLKKCFRVGVDKYDPITLGALTTILSQKTTCGLCRMISLLISRNWRLERLHPDEDLTLVQVKLLIQPCGWADSDRYNEPRTCAHNISVIVSGTRPSAIARMIKKEKVGLTLELQMMEDDAARFGRDRAFHGHRVRAEVSIERVREWLWICEKEHGPACANVLPRNATKQLPQGARMIDVVHMAIVEAPRNCRYIALSYVWGKMSTEYLTLLGNVAERHKRDSLKSVGLPRTIRDAIKLVQELKERYLWVDALCIIQDDPVNKDTQIAGMQMIYGMATLTIVAAGGKSAHAPLPGLEPGSRKELQHIESIQSLQLAVPLRSLQEMLAGSVWDTRGWTFQEQILSRRKLFFTNEQLFFKCQRDVFSEDRIVESSKKTASYLAKLLGTIKLQTPERPLRYKHDFFYKSYARKFMQVIEEYTRRQLTNPADLYIAIFAIITVFSRDYEITPLDPKKAFLFGMPMSVLETVMLWQPALDAPAHVRRREKGLVTPSWSWAGWKGIVVYDVDFSDGYSDDIPGSWWEGSLVDEWVIGDPHGQARRISTVRPLQRPTYVDVPVKYIGLPSSPSVLLVEEGESLVPGTLLFRTTAASLRVRKFEKQVDEIAMSEEVRVDDNKFYSRFKILSDTSPPAVMGSIVLLSDTDTTVPVEFVVLSRPQIDKPRPDTFDQQAFGNCYFGCLLNVMAVKRVDIMVDGVEVSQRVGVGVIVEAAWIAAGFCERVVRLQ